MQKITPFLWFIDNAQAAADFYVSVFRSAPGASAYESKILEMNHYDKASAEVSGRPEGSVMVVSLRLGGNEFSFINGGPPPTEADGFANFQFSGAISFVINCETQEEVDYFWEKLSEGGEQSVCGWISKDKFGITWQVTPTILPKMLSDPDPVKAQRAMEAMLKMKKIIIADLEKAYNG